LKYPIWNQELTITLSGSTSQIASDIANKKGAEPLLTLPLLTFLAGGFAYPPPEGALKGGGT